ncbi:MAG: cation transporter [Desulfobacterales bacterium]|nr:cation transporter [Desulfobacterales bacterium]
MKKHKPIPNTADSLKTAFFLNLGFTFIEIIGGLWTNSIAILSDSLHDLGDSFSLGLSWYLEKYSQKEMDQKFSFGYRRFSLAGALANGMVIIVGAIFILSKALPRLIDPQPTHPGGMVLLAFAGILINGLAAFRLRSGKSLNAQMVTWHLIEDVLGWSAILVIGIILLFKNWPILDPILSILIILYVLYHVVQNLKKTFAVFLQAVPDNIDIKTIENKIQAIDRVKSVHHTQIWSLDGEHHVLTSHIVVDQNTTKKQVLEIKCAIHELTQNIGFEHITIEIEYEQEACRLTEMENH